MRAVVLVAAAAVCTGGCGACEPSPPQGNDGAAASGAAATASAPPPPIDSARAHPPAQRLACRSIAVEGDVHVETTVDAGVVPLLIEGLVPTEGWLALGKGAKFVAKDPRTTRETTFRGPGRVRACVGYAEESWIGAGGFDSTMGSGESPGAEEWVVTPLAVIRYAAAKLSVDVRPKEETLSVTGGGVAFLWLGDDARFRLVNGGASEKKDEGWIRLDGSAVSVTPASGTPDTLDAARGALDRCSTLAKSTRELTSTLMAGGADAAVVTQQVTSRRLARAACDVANLRISALPPSEASMGLAKSLVEADAAWTTIGP